MIVVYKINYTMALSKKSAGAVVFYLKNEEPIYLLLRNTLKKTFWAFPKGQIEKNESEEQAATREVKEETNLDIKIIPGFRQEQNWYYQLEGQTIKKNAVFFIAEVSEQEMRNTKISDEHEDFSWFNYEDAKKVSNIKSNREMLKLANDFVIEYKKQKKLFS